MSEPKELSFFTTEFNWHQGRDWYSRFFEQAGNAVAVGEASVHYSDASFFPDVAKRIARLVPSVRLIYLMRDPIERTVSEYYHRGAYEAERRPIDVAVLDPCLWSKSMYSHQIDTYLRYFDRRQMLLITTEDLARDAQGTIRQVLSFIGADPEWKLPEPELVSNRRGNIRRFAAVQYPGEVQPHTEVLSSNARNNLLRLLAPDLRRLPQYFDRSFNCWSLSL
jgi:hypothetical protein